MEFTIEIEKYEAGVVVTYNGDEHEVDLQTRNRHDVEFEIDDNDIDLREFDEDQLKNHLESIYGPMYMEGEEEDMKEHLEEEGYFVADCIDYAEMITHLEDKGYFVANNIDEAEKRIKEWLTFNKYIILKPESFIAKLLKMVGVK